MNGPVCLALPLRQFVYIIGFGTLCTYVVHIAPKRFSEESFQRRWKFLFIKYRPGAWWWTIAFCTKGVSLNLGLVFLDQGFAQIIWVIAFIGVYMSIAMVYNPWRHRAANFFEIFSHMTLLSVLALLMWFAHGAVDNTKQVADDISILLIAIHAHVLFVAGCVMLFLHLAKHVNIDVSKKCREAYASIAQLQPDDFHLFLNKMSEGDWFYLYQAADVIRSEYLGQVDGSKRISGMAAKRGSFSSGGPSQISSDIEFSI